MCIYNVYGTGKTDKTFVNKGASGNPIKRDHKRDMNNFDTDHLHQDGLARLT